MELLAFALVLGSSLAFPPPHYAAQHALLKRPSLTHEQQQQQQVPAEGREQVNSVRVSCLPDSLDIVIKADMFGVGASVDGDDLRLGVEFDDLCRATASSDDEFRIVVGLMDCGTKHWMTQNSLVYTNLLIYSPTTSPDGLIRMDEAVIPIECHYDRKYSLSSSSLSPTWLPFTSTQAGVEILDFDLRIMTSDWLYKRSSNVFYLGDVINVEASVRVGHHVGLRVFVSSCVATLDPDIYSVPRYVFVENGCMVDSELQGSKSSFLPRTQDDKLLMVIDAFRFHNEDRGQLYITCHVNAVPLNDAENPNKACTLLNGRWRSADGNDFLCGQCQKQNEGGQTQTKPGNQAKFGPRMFMKQDTPESSRSGMKSKAVWEQEASVGPVLVLPAKHKSGHLPGEGLPLKMNRPKIYSSQWRSGLNQDDLNDVHPAQSTLDEVMEEDDEGEMAPTDEVLSVEMETELESKGALPYNNATEAPSDADTLPALVKLDLTSNSTAVETNLSETSDPKK